MKTMQAKQYGSHGVFQLTEQATPTPKANEVVIRNYASTVTAADIMMRTGKPRIGRLYLGLFKPKQPILGYDFAGEVVAIGENVNKFNVGDRVFGGTTALGCYAEYICIKQDEVVCLLPERISYEQAAPIAGSAVTVLNFLCGKGKLKSGQHVLIYGASGALGTYSIQVAKQLGAEVTAVCSGKNAALVKSLGADHVIDYTREDFTQQEKKYDLIFDTVGKIPFSKCKNSLVQHGIYLCSNLNFSLMWTTLRSSMFGSKKAMTSATGMLPVPKRLAYLEELRELIAAGKIHSVIDRTYPLVEMGAAHQYVEQGHKIGNVIIAL